MTFLDFFPVECKEDGLPNKKSPLLRKSMTLLESGDVALKSK